MDGFLLVDKPIGLTSYDVVAKVRSLLRTEIRNQQLENSKNRLIPNSQLLFTASPKVKIGHTGTLDPLASGLMILVLGSYTKRAGEFSKMDKTYEAEITLGAVSVTGDKEGPITPKNSKKPLESDIRAVLNSFTGKIEQTPHIHSAVKIGGQRAYKLARQGKKFKIEPRKVTIYSIEKVHYNYPKLSFVTEVSSGTYIRSLAEDIGQKLGTGAYVSTLRRTQVGRFDIEDAQNLEKLNISKFKTEVVKE